MNRVVITGMGVITSNGHGLEEFEQALRAGKSGITRIPEMEEYKFSCLVGGRPAPVDDKLPNYFSEEDLTAMNEGMIYAGMAGIDAWRDAGFEKPAFDDDHVNWDAGCEIGAGLGGIDTLTGKVHKAVTSGKVRRMGSTTVEMSMNSSVSAKMSGLLALGGQVTSNSSACNTGTEAIADCFFRIRAGMLDRMLAGGVEGSSPFCWGPFDAMRVINPNSNDAPEKASRPMSASAGGFIPGAGSGIVMLENLESAQKRGARIYAEILGADVNCGGHRMGGSMTAPNKEGVQRCLKTALKMAGVTGHDIDYINGHLTATFADPHEIDNWSKGLGRDASDFPLVNSTKSMIGHCLGAAGGVETVAAILQMHKGFAHKSINCEDLHPDIEPYAGSIVRETRDADINLMAKASFGFGDVNGVLIIKKWTD